MEMLKQAIVSMVRKELSDDEILILVRGRLDENGRTAVEVDKETPRPPQRFRPRPDGLSDNEALVLEAIEANKDNKLSFAQLEAQLSLSHGATKGALDRLIEKGLVNRIGEGGGKKRPRRFLFSPA